MNEVNFDVPLVQNPLCVDPTSSAVQRRVRCAHVADHVEPAPVSDFLDERYRVRVRRQREIRTVVREFRVLPRCDRMDGFLVPVLVDLLRGRQFDQTGELSPRVRVRDPKRDFDPVKL